MSLIVFDRRKLKAETPVLGSLAKRQKRYFPQGAIPEDFRAWAERQVFPPIDLDAAFAQWLVEKANLKNPLRLLWEDANEQARYAVTDLRHERSEDEDRQHGMKSRKTVDLESKADFWKRVAEFNTPALICETCQFRLRIDSAFIWSQALTKDLYQKSYFQDFFEPAAPGAEQKSIIVMNPRNVGKTTAQELTMRHYNDTITIDQRRSIHRIKNPRRP